MDPLVFMQTSILFGRVLGENLVIQDGTKLAFLYAKYRLRDVEALTVRSLLKGEASLKTNQTLIISVSSSIPVGWGTLGFARSLIL